MRRTLPLSFLIAFSGCTDQISSPSSDFGLSAIPVFSVVDDGAISLLAPLDGFQHSEAYDINASGQVVGVSFSWTGPSLEGLTGGRATLWDNGSIVDLGVLPGHNYSLASAINDAGQVVGWSAHTSNLNESRAFLWDNGVLTDLGTLGGTRARANDINNAGEVAGSSRTTNSSSTSQGFFWKNGTMTGIGALVSNGGSLGHALNDSGVVVGSSEYTSDHYRPVRWDGTMLPLVSRTRTIGSASAINNYGQAVGDSDYTGGERAVTYSGGSRFPLPEPMDFVHSSAVDINDGGDIAGFGSDGLAVHTPLYWQRRMPVILAGVSGHTRVRPTGMNSSRIVVGSYDRQNGNPGRAVVWNLPSVPAAPDAAAATQLSSPTRIKISWTIAATNVGLFEIERRAQTGGDWTDWTFLAAAGGERVSDFDYDIVDGTSYEYRVRACNRGGCSAYATPATAAPEAPLNAVATPISSTQIDIGWTDASDNETKFQMHRRQQNPDGTWGSWQALVTLSANDTGHSDTGLTPATGYRYRVRACNAIGCSLFAVSSPVVTPGT